MPGGLYPYTHAATSLFQLAVKRFGFTVLVLQSPFTGFSSF